MVYIGVIEQKRNIVLGFKTVTDVFVSADLESCLQQADLPKLIQDEDVCNLGRHAHAVRNISQSLQPPVSTTLNTSVK